MTRSRFQAIALALVFVTPALTGCSGSSDPARIPAEVSRSKPIMGEDVEITGAASAGRSLVLEQKLGGSWTEVATGRATVANRFSFTVSATSDRAVFRVRAPEPNGGKVGYSRLLQVTGVEATATLEVAGGAVGQTKQGTQDLIPAEAIFFPKRPGAPVRIQRRDSSDWQTIGRGVQNENGRFALQLEPSALPEGASLRAVTVPDVQIPSVKSDPLQPQAWRPVWSDEFDGDALDPSKWRTREQAATGRRLCATPSADRVAVRDGAAVLSVKRVGPKSDACPYGVFENAMIGTGVAGFTSFSPTYGLFAARVKFQSGRGQHGSFWMQGPAETGAEIDVAEYFGEGRADGGLSTFVHYTSKDGELSTSGGILKGASALLGVGKTPANSWHVYSVEWSPRGYVFRLDGVTTLRTDKPYIAKVPEILVLSLLTSDWELPALTSTRSTMQVDWVRAWQE